MKLDDDKIIRTIKKLRTDPLICPICGCTDFTLNDTIAGIMTNRTEVQGDLSSYISSAILVCKKCGHVDFFVLDILLKSSGADDNDRNS